MSDPLTDAPQFNSWSSRLKYWAATWMVKSKRLKREAMDVQTITDMLNDNLPTSLDFPVPGGTANLLIYNGEISLNSTRANAEVTLFCELKVEAMANRIYQAHAVATLSLTPAYDRDSQCLYPKDLVIDDLTLVKDRYSLIKDTQNLFKSLMPSPLKSMMDVTIKTTVSTMNLLSVGAYDDAKGYFELYRLGSMQKVLDYHKPQIEALLQEQVDNGELQYQMDQRLFDERLFAELGQGVEIKDGQLWFVFHS